MKVALAKKILMVGVGGSGMRNLAWLLGNMDKEIIGFDTQVEVLKDEPSMDFVKLVEEVDEVGQFDLLIYSDAVPPEDPLRLVALNNKVRQIAYHQAVAELVADKKLVAVTGTHGKSTTTAMLAHILIEAGLKPSALLGAGVSTWDGRGAVWGDGDIFVLEADEYRDHFLAYRPAGAIVTSIDFDHPDYFSSFDKVRQSFGKFLAKVGEGWVVTHKQLRGDFDDIAWPSETILAAELEDDEAEAVVGKHMRSNAALAMAAAQRLGVPREKALAALDRLPQLHRRMEEIGMVGDMLVISDYGHHPAEVAATLLAARERYGDNKILVLLEVHTFERLITFLDDFAESLKQADGVLLVPLFMPTGREGERALAEEKMSELERHILANNVPVERVKYDDLAAGLEQRKGDYNIAFSFSAGRLDGHLRSIVN